MTAGAVGLLGATFVAPIGVVPAGAAAGFTLGQVSGVWITGAGANPAGFNINQAVGVWVNASAQIARVRGGGILNDRHLFDIDRDDMELIRMVINFLNIKR